MTRQVDRLAVFPSQLGWIAIQTRGQTLVQLSFGLASPEKAFAALDRSVAAGATVGEERSELSVRLQAYAEGAIDQFLDVKLDPGPQTDFQKRIVQKCRRIAYGSTMTYGELAEAAGFSRAARAVGSAMRTNRTPLVVPCHRVVGSSGKPGGFSAGEGVRLKLRLLELERLGICPPGRKQNRPGN